MKRLAVFLIGSAAIGSLAGTPAGASTVPDPAEGDPIVIEHRFGETELDEVPERIVTLDLQWTDVLLSVGVEPVGYLASPFAGAGGIYPWEAGMLDDATPIEATSGLPMEQIAALDPDLILVGFEAAEQEQYEQLAAIAPTVGLLGELQVDDWQAQLDVVAEVTGRDEQAADVLADIEGLVSDTVAGLPGLEGRTYALVNYVEGDGLFYVVADPEDGSSQLFYDLGLEIDPDLLGIEPGTFGRIELSFENVAMLEADILVVFAQTGDPADVPGWDALPAVQSGAVISLDFAAVSGLNQPTPLSIPYSLDLIAPTLELAAGAA
jgi:iron complex transport system substrate-binding protein